RVLGEAGVNWKEVRLNDLRLQEVEARVYGGPRMRFSMRFPADNALGVIQSLMAKPEFPRLEYLDFRVERRAYYK
ncbi:MAG: hypothetical protein AAB967_04385, partial [Patescibacteria group bacterium]